MIVIIEINTNAEIIIKEKTNIKKKNCYQQRYLCPYQQKYQCHLYQVNAENEDVQDLLWPTTDVIKLITMVNFGIPFRGFPA